MTSAPLTGDPFAITVATSGAANAVLTVALCGVPPVAVIDMTAPVMFVKLKLAGVATPATEAVTAYPPAVPLAVNGAEVAMPFASVVSVSVAVPFANVPLAPEDGAVNVTVAPLTGYWLLSTTVATSGARNAVSMVASCRDPLVAIIVAAAPDVFVNAKLVEAVTPATVAVTVSAPMTPLAVKIDEVATPFESVVSVSEADEFDEKVPLAPVVGAVKRQTPRSRAFRPWSRSLPASLRMRY